MERRALGGGPTLTECSPNYPRLWSLSLSLLTLNILFFLLVGRLCVVFFFFYLLLPACERVYARVYVCGHSVVYGSLI
jgi:hypothetical protein